MKSKPFSTKQEAKKTQELWVLKRFKEAYPPCPDGDIDANGERPDFIIKTPSGGLGIEVAHVFKDDIGNGSRLKRNQSMESKIGWAVIELIQKHSNASFGLDIDYNIHKPIEALRKEFIIRQCAIACLNVLLNQSNGRYKMLNYNNAELPEEIDGLSLEINDSIFDGGQYLESGGGTVGKLTFEHIEPLLTKHSASLMSYRKCYAYWFIIYGNSWTHDSFCNFEQMPVIHTGFERVFFYSIKDCNVTPLV